MNARVESSLAAEIDRVLQTFFRDTASQYETPSDIYMGGYLDRQRLGKLGEIKSGIVKHALPYMNCYKCSVEGLDGEVIAVKANSTTSSSGFGAISLEMIEPGTSVLLLWKPGAINALILGVEPNQTTDGNYLFSDYTSQGSNVGLHKDGYHQAYMTSTGDEGGATNLNAHRPIDQLVYDTGFNFITGVGLFADPNMAYMRASEFCGLFLFADDEHTRLVGRSLDIWSEAGTFSQYNDDGELHTVREEFMYQHEMLGAFSDDSEKTQDTDPADVVYKKPLGPLEPLLPDQKPFARYREYGGYLGRGHIRELHIPPQGASGGVNSYSSSDLPICVFREHIDAGGGISVQSAREIVLSKRLIVPAGERIRMPADLRDAADKPDNYKAAGLYGNGPAHTANDVNKLGEYKNLLSMAAIFDIHTAKTNWGAISTFRYHKGDYRTPEEVELLGRVGTNQIRLNFAELKAKAWMEAPSPTRLYTDHVLDSVEYYELMSHISITPMGDIVMQAGMGAELRMTSGIQFGGPGNVVIQSGKTIALLGGDDIAVRARNSVDVTADKKDARFKAGKNVMIGSAMGEEGVGVMLLESRSKTAEQDWPADGGEKIKGNGIIFKAKESVVASLSKDVYIRTCGPNLGDGNIVLDCNDGRGDIIQVAGNHFRFARGRIVDAFGFENVNKINEFVEGRAIVGGQLWVDGDARIVGGVIARNSIVSTSGGFQSLVGGEVGRLVEPDYIDSFLREVSQEEYSKTKEYQESYRSYVKTPYKETDKPGNEDTIRKVSFSLRTQKDYATEDFVLPEAYWQFLAALGGGMEPWDEKPVKYQDAKEMLPWPGKEPWEQDTLLTIEPGNLRHFDVGNGVAKPTDGGAYEVPVVNPFVRKAPKSAYLVLNMGE